MDRTGRMSDIPILRPVRQYQDRKQETQREDTWTAIKERKQLERCINCVDFEEALDNIHRDSLWRILRTYGIPPHSVDLIKLFYEKIEQSDIALWTPSPI